MFTPRSEDQVADAIASHGRGGLIARGAGCSYGDAAQNAGGAVIDMTRLDRVINVDASRCVITAEAGATVAKMMARLAAYGLTLPVVPGTRHVTLAGAIASDIHGKNHHRDGGFARHVESISLCTAEGEVRELGAEEDPGLFYATLGGMGLTGVILKATLRAEPLAHAWVVEDLDRTIGLEQTLELMAGEEPRRYSVAWLDMLADGPRMGRALVSRADPLPDDAPRPRRRGRAARAYPGALSNGPVLRIPESVPNGMLRRAAVRAFNAARWHAAPRMQRERPLPLASYFFPLDVVGSWNRLYGRTGFVQHQFVIPYEEDAQLRRCFEALRKLPVYLAVFKRFGPAFGGPLSFPLRGWTLAADLPASAPGLREGLDRLDELVVACGGRVYLTKDVRLRREHVLAMYPALPKFLAERERVDPGDSMRSDLGVRLGLCGVRP
jgi:decaprenylphospho-beta-D-ribofuranose 2-oxidase